MTARRRLVMGALGAVLVAAAVVIGLRWRRREPSVPDVEYGRLRARLEAVAAADPSVAEAAALGGNVRVAVRAPLVEAVFRRAAAAYLDRVELDLELDLPFREAGNVAVKVLGRRVEAGSWHVDGAVHRARGVLRAKTPELRASGGDRLSVRLPVTLQAGRGIASVHFQWDGRSLGGLVCRDFHVTRTVEGVVLPADYVMDGAFRLSAGRTGLRAEPEFPRARHRLRLDLTDESWKQVLDALAEQDRLLRCGLALDPDEMRAKLAGVLRKGFDISLPRSLFRAIDFPAAVRTAAQVEDQRVELEVAPAGLQVTPRAVWYSTTLSTRVRRTD